MNSGPEATASATELARRMAPPAAPLAMPDQVIERKRLSGGLLSLFALPFFAVK